MFQLTDNGLLFNSSNLCKYFNIPQQPGNDLHLFLEVTADGILSPPPPALVQADFQAFQREKKI